MSSVPSINAYAAVHTRHHGNCAESKSESIQPNQHQSIPVPMISKEESSNLKPEGKGPPDDPPKGETVCWAKSSIFEMLGNFIGKLNFVGHDGVFLDTSSEVSDKNSSQPDSENISILSKVRHLSSSSAASSDESPYNPLERKSTSD